MVELVNSLVELVNSLIELVNSLVELVNSLVELLYSLVKLVVAALELGDLGLVARVCLVVLRLLHVELAAQTVDGEALLVEHRARLLPTLALHLKVTLHLL